jgi:hypothetical protein
LLDLYDEFKVLISALTLRKIDYALCGGLAMAVHGIQRATVDIDLLIPTTALDKAKDVARDLGFTAEALPMTFSGKAVEIHRTSKIDPDSGDVLMIDFLLVTPQIMNAWKTKTEVEWENGKLWVVSREGLIELYRLAHECDRLFWSAVTCHRF